MKVTPIDPPRVFEVGVGNTIRLKDCARITLEPDEQVTFVTAGGAEYDVVRKQWGYYATPSLNGRLLHFGFQAALVRSGERFYVLLVEKDKHPDFQAYLQAQNMEVVCWLSTWDKAPGLWPLVARGEERPNRQLSIGPCPLCASTDFSLLFAYDTPPAGETSFPLPAHTPYSRQIWQCQVCRLFVNRLSMNLEGLYQGDYVDATYGADQLLSTFQRILALPPQRSDNHQRVQRLLRYMAEVRSGGEQKAPPTVLDVGSGLCVFLQRMKEAGWQCTALDPDGRAVEHARRSVGIQAIQGDFMNVSQLGSYDLITFNKVLEHVPDPVAMLQKSHQHLRPGGVVYLEVPDGETAAAAGAGREEFFIEHLWVFSLTSLSLLATRAGFAIHCIERVREPSSKYTLRAFLQQP
jgi:SAM-dependent methyltransferase